MRGMSRVLLPSEVESDHLAEENGKTISKMLKISPFSTVVPVQIEQKLRHGDGSAFEQLSAMLELEPRHLMLVSDHRATISAARGGRVFSCYFLKNVEGAPARIPSDYTITKISQVKDAIEELNGVTFRSFDTEIKTKYGVNCT